ncbi:MAG: hypothetical protein PHS16_02060 [Candidatus Colwellbacteria bacterium]|jgi:hypothetical protein|nr:hypothetical protein [Candidatus Colwellbacteria bacterium]MCK9497359.1 hypothetical protein [Candidatus Colwellbacteria bacterium]MDD3752701.1 hypothetical protein [Candidatus Colwellbacteria bacterium]MDD4818757.1 hypothetical protein [Candidatus Colwellbacteria bacterium]
MAVELKKVLFTEKAVISRPLLPREKDSYTFNWFSSMWNSTLSLGGTGISMMILSLLGHKLFQSITEIASSAYLEISEKTINAECFIAKAVFFAGGGLLIKSILNTRKN